MRWSELKRRTEANFADSVRGRVEVFATRYRHAHDGAGEVWVVVDGERVAVMGDIAYRKARLGLERELGSGARGPVEQGLQQRGVFSDEDVKQALFAALGLSIDEILAHENPILRAFGWLDRRCGKRRLAAFDLSAESELAKRFHAIRCIAEGIQIRGIGQVSESR